MQRRKGRGSCAKIKKGVRRFALLDGGLRGKAHFTHPTEINPNAPPKPLGSPRFQPGGRYFSAGVRKPPDPGNNKTILFFLDAPASFFNTSQLDIYSV